MSNSDNSNRTNAEAWKEIRQRSAAMSSVQQFKQQYLSKDRRSEGNKLLWNGQYKEAKEKRNGSYTSESEAVRAIIFDAAWYTNYDIELVTKIVKASAYKRGESYTKDGIRSCIVRAFKMQDGASWASDDGTDGDVNTSQNNDNSRSKSDYTPQKIDRNRGQNPLSNGLDGASMPRNNTKL